MEKETSNTKKERVEIEKSGVDVSKNWLQRLKDESWNAEILISTIAIFGTIQLFKIISWTTNIFINILPPNQYLFGYVIVFFALLAVSILASMFIIHFVLRAYWVGLVGLNSVFSDYSIEDSAYSKIYTEKIISILPKLKDSIIKVDELCSVIFSAAFTVLFMYLYMGLFASVYLLLFNFLLEYVPFYLLLIPAGIILFLVFFQMVFGIIANIKKNKENIFMQTWLFKMVTFTNFLLMGPLYKSIMQIMMIFSSNFKKKKSIIYLLLSFLVFGMITAIFQMQNTNIPYLIGRGTNIPIENNIGYYQTENNTIDFLLSPEITSDIVQKNILKVFIPIYKYEKNLRKNICNTYKKDKSLNRIEQIIEKRSYYLKCYQKYNQIYLNNERVHTEFSKYNHPKTGQFGVVAYIRLADNVVDGKNILKVKKDYGNDNNIAWNIPFQYLPK